ncbi:MAG: Uma2 family endonuclease [Hyphomicrobium sp.]
MPGSTPTTQAAEGLLRRRFSVAEIEAMVKAGILGEDERFELIGGEVVPMSPKGIRHELLKNALIRFWGKRCTDEIHFAIETTFRLDADSFVEPDIVFYRRSDGLGNLKPETVLLAVEVADSSLAYDLGRKVRIYASYGVREVWVINAQSLVTSVHSRPGLDGYIAMSEIASHLPLTPIFAPEIAVTLGNLELR